MEYAKILQKSAGKSDYRESPLKTLMKVNDLKKTINKDGRANIIKKEPYANRIATYLSNEELKRKTNDGARQYLSGVKQYYNNIALSALSNSPEDQSTYLKEARKQTQQMKLLNDAAQVEYLRKVDPLGLFYLEKRLESQNQRIQEAMNDPTGDNLRNLLRGQPLNVPNDLSSEPDSVFTHGLDSLRSKSQVELTQSARDALQRHITSGAYDSSPALSIASEEPIVQQHAQELMDENPDLDDIEADRQARENVVEAREIAYEDELRKKSKQLSSTAIEEAMRELEDERRAQYEDELSKKSKQLSSTAIEEAMRELEYERNPLLLDYRPEMVQQPGNIPSMGQLKKYGRISLERIAQTNNIPYDKETTDSELRKRIILKQKQYTGILPNVEMMPYASELETKFMSAKELRELAKSKGVTGITKNDKAKTVLEKAEKQNVKLGIRLKPKGSGFRPLSSYPPHIIAGALHIVKQRKKLRTNPNEYNREQAHHLMQKAIHGEGFFSDLKDKIGMWLFKNVHPVGRLSSFVQSKS
jgi:hypothetical protein